MRAWDHGVTASLATTLPYGVAATIDGLCHTDTRIYGLQSVAGTDYLRAWDYNGARQAGDDINLGSLTPFSCTATGTRFFVGDSIGTILRAWDHDGARQAGDDIDIAFACPGPRVVRHPHLRAERWSELCRGLRARRHTLRRRGRDAGIGQLARRRPTFPERA